ncbi:MAG: methylglyoxal synthase [Lachnospirales bacterium]
MNIALIAHDRKKDLIVEYCKVNKNILEKHNLVATGTTGTRISQETELTIKKFKSGPLGGDQQIGGLVCQRDLDLVIFLRDPLTSQPHEPDVNALLRLCDVYSIPIATNLTSANICMEMLKEHAENFGVFQHIDI